MHHTLGDGDFGHFIRMAKEVNVATAQLTAENATAEIDRVLSSVIQQHRPGYLLLPVDVAQAETAAPVHPLVSSASSTESLRSAFRQAAERLLAPAQRVSLLADFLAQRWQQQPALAALRAGRAFPCATLLMGKGVLDEQQPGFVGTYAGEGSEGPVRQQIEEADVTLCVGVRFTDTITAGFTQQFRPDRLIDVQPHSASVAGQTFAPLSMADALQTLLPLFERYGAGWQSAGPVKPAAPVPDATIISQSAFWQAMQSLFSPAILFWRIKAPRRLARRRCACLPGRSCWYSRYGIHRLYSASRVWCPDGTPVTARHPDHWRWFGTVDHSGTRLDAAG